MICVDNEPSHLSITKYDYNTFERRMTISAILKHDNVSSFKLQFKFLKNLDPCSDVHPSFTIVVIRQRRSGFESSCPSQIFQRQRHSSLFPELLLKKARFDNYFDLRRQPGCRPLECIYNLTLLFKKIPIDPNWKYYLDQVHRWRQTIFLLSMVWDPLRRSPVVRMNGLELDLCFFLNQLAKRATVRHMQAFFHLQNLFPIFNSR